ncbi:MAG: [acyl-carrier-protein] S-malonyltransferase [Alteromonadaceae bacterium]|nr:MAG: [acyl-carrier-protein] S-malonyltransferase [Alteromonadaceae bacterium]
MSTYLFPGQGSQIKGMGESLFDEFPDVTKKADEILGYSIKSLCLLDESGVLDSTAYTQPALYVVNALSYLQKVNLLGRKPDFLAGHSLGELNALQAAGAVSFEEGLQLVKKRGELMSKSPSGAMAALLNIQEDAIAQCLQSEGLDLVDIANVNSPRQIVISGDFEQVQASMKPLENAGARFIPLNTSGAFHSRQMLAAKNEFEEYLRGFSFKEITIPVISNVHALPYQQESIADNLSEQICKPVKWMQSIRYLLDRGEFEFEELGVGDVLTKLVSAISAAYTEEKDIALIASVEEQTAIIRQRVNDWNEQRIIGTPVNVDGYSDVLATRSKAAMIFGHSAAIYLEGYRGYFLLDDISVMNNVS